MIADHISEAVSVVSSIWNANFTLPNNTTSFSLPQGSGITVSSCLFICVWGQWKYSSTYILNIGILEDVVSFTPRLFCPWLRANGILPVGAFMKHGALLSHKEE